MLARLLGSLLVVASGLGFYSFTEMTAAAAAEAELAREIAAEEARAAALVAVADARTRDSVLAAFDEHYDDLYKGLYQYPNLRRSERAVLRRAPYHAHVSASRGVGVNAQAGLHLVPVPRESDYYVLEKGRGLLAPAAVEALELIGERFQAECAAAGLPRVRFIVTSAFRSAADQARLRRVNRNAARTTSSHEFGGSFDITYRRYAPLRPGAAPRDFALDTARLASRLHGPLGEALSRREATASERPATYGNRAYQAALGRVLIQLQREGRTFTLRERRQPCYHVTARPVGA